MNKILVISMTGIGDTLIATPVFHELRLAYPKAKIDAVVYWPGSRELLENNPYVDRVYQQDLLKAGPLGSMKFLWGLRGEGYDLSINVHTQGRRMHRFIAYVIGARLRVGHEYENWFALDRLFMQRSVPQSYEHHSVDNNLELLKLVGVKPQLAEHDFELFLTDAERAFANEFIERQKLKGRRLVGFHVGSGSTKNLSLKRWPLDNYLGLMRAILERHPDFTLVLFGGPQEREDHQRILREVPSDRILEAQTKNIRQAGALMQHCEAFVSVDTALMHLAAAMKVPKQIVIEAFTLNRTNEPRRPYFRVPNPAVGGRNLDYYRYDGKPIKGERDELIRCMASVTVEAVYKVFNEAVLK